MAVSRRTNHMRWVVSRQKRERGARAKRVFLKHSGGDGEKEKRKKRRVGGESDGTRGDTHTATAWAQAGALSLSLGMAFSRADVTTMTPSLLPFPLSAAALFFVACPYARVPPRFVFSPISINAFMYCEVVSDRGIFCWGAARLFDRAGINQQKNMLRRAGRLLTVHRVTARGPVPMHGSAERCGRWLAARGRRVARATRPERIKKTVKWSGICDFSFRLNARIPTGTRYDLSPDTIIRLSNCRANSA